MNMRPVLPVLLLALPLAAQEWPGPDTIGVQVRVSQPGGDLSDATSSNTPGVGASLLAELHFDSTVCARLNMGADDWSRPGASGDRSVRSFQLGGEALWFLVEDRDDWLKGPYLVGGIHMVNWSLGASASGTGSTLRVTHAAYTAGIGYRLSRHLDAEVKVLAGVASPTVNAAAVQVAVSYRL